MKRREFLKIMVGGMTILPLTTPYGILSTSLSLNTILDTGKSPKSIIFSPDMKSAYLNNLQSGSVFEIDSLDYTINKIINYERTPILYKGVEPSFEEKPVESCLTHNGTRLWTSLHNAKGVTVQNVNGKRLKLDCSTSTKKVRIEDYIKGIYYQRELPFINTGSTPKILQTVPDESLLFVSNWDSGTLSVLDTETGKNYKNIKVGHAPRGLTFTSDSKTGFVANFFSNSITIFDVDNLRVEKTIESVGVNPRHLLLNENKLYASFHGDGYLRRFNLQGSLEDELYIGGQLRTMTSTTDFKKLFVDSYNKNEVVMVDTETFKVENRKKSLYKPVGAAYNHKTKQLWVVNQGNATIYVFDVFRYFFK